MGLADSLARRKAALLSATPDTSPWQPRYQPEASIHAGCTPDTSDTSVFGDNARTIRAEVGETPAEVSGVAQGLQENPAFARAAPPIPLIPLEAKKTRERRAAANDPAPARPPQPRPAVIREPQHPGDPQEEALALLDQLHAWGVVLSLEHGELRAHGLDRLPAELREEVDALMHPAVMGRDLLAAVQARDAAMQAIERAPLQRCWGCRHVTTFDAHRGHAPRCQRGHALTWRDLNPGRRTTPLRVDQRGPCGDYTKGEHHGD